MTGIQGFFISFLQLFSKSEIVLKFKTHVKGIQGAGTHLKET